MKQATMHAGSVRKKDGFVKTFKKNFPLTLMALPALVVMILFGIFPCPDFCLLLNASACARESSEANGLA